MGHVVVVFLEPVAPRLVGAVLPMLGVGDDDGVRRVREDRLQTPDVVVHLRVVQDVAVHLGERRVAVADSAQQDHELEQVGVGLLPERFLRPAEQVVQERRHGVRHRVGIELVVQRVVADAGVEPDLDVVVGSVRARKDGLHLATEVPLHLQDQTAHLLVFVIRLPAKQLLDVRIHAAGRLPGADGAEHHDARVEASLRDRQPRRIRCSAGCGVEVRFAEHQRELRPLRSDAGKVAAAWSAPTAPASRTGSRAGTSQTTPPRTAW